MLHVISFKWNGWRNLYGPENVNAQKRMLEKYLTIPHTYTCITDDPTGLECDYYPLWSEPHIVHKPTHHDSYCRLKMFSQEMAEVFPGWVLNLDLDILIRKNIDNLITWDELRILKNGVTPYNGSMWLHKTGTRTHVWDSFDSEKSPFEIPKHKRPDGKPWVGSDQGWLSVTCPNERLYDTNDGVYRWSTRFRQIYKKSGFPKNTKIVFFSGYSKPWHEEMRQINPKIHEEYMQFTN